MLNTRSFIKSLLVAAIAPIVLIPRAKDTFKWKVLPASGIYIPNSDYVTAPYEVAFLYHPDMKPIIFKRNKKGNLKSIHGNIEVEQYPIRFNSEGESIFPIIFKQYA